MDIQEINIGESNDGPKLNIIEKDLTSKKSVNFGPGADLLMNPNKQKQKNNSSNMEISDINEINIGGPSLKDARNSLFGDINLPKDDNIKINFNEDGKIGDSENFIKKDILKNAAKKEKSE